MNLDEIPMEDLVAELERREDEVRKQANVWFAREVIKVLEDAIREPNSVRLTIVDWEGRKWKEVRVRRE